jgi:hypothetical protein
MPIRDLWIAALTSTQSDSGSDDELVSIINQNERDIVHRDLGFGDSATGGGKLYHHDISESLFEPETDFYMRIGIRGSDAWRPSVIAAWGERLETGAVVPLGYDETLDVVLSTDSSEGRISLPVPRIRPGEIRSDINRVMLVTGTGFGDFGTDSPIHVRIVVEGGEVVVNHTIPDTSQDDFDAAEGNVYFIPVIRQFTRSQLTDTSIEISIEGDDAWRPIVVVIFGLNTSSGQPTRMTPLVHLHPWGTQVLSRDLSEGVPSVTLPLAPIDP